MSETPDRQVTGVCVFAALHGPGLGDLVQRNIMLALIRRAHPHARVTLVVGEELAARFAELFAAHTYATDVLTCPPDEAHPRWPAFLRTLAGRRYERCVIDPDSAALHAGHALAAGIPDRIGLPLGRPGDEHITRPLRLPPPVWGRPDLFDHATALAGALGLPGRLRAGQLVPDLPRRPGPARPARPASAGPVVAVHPGGAPHWNRRWPPSRYADLCVRLATRRSAALRLLGTAPERAELRALRDTVRAGAPGADVRVETGADLNRTANLLAGADLLVGNDSALAHLAAAVRTPSVVIYGPTGTEFLWTRIYPHHRGVSLRWPCQSLLHAPGRLEDRRCAHDCVLPYRGPEGPYPRCLTALPVERVWAAVTAQLASSPPATIRSTP
ncbi:glycosyltransferase family 9 protein [Streptomyces sp. NPDC046215]|uniref:glycosyltransferase family 9 protein n=1 Tax=Streptomyces sp. NPDC046215 TaxID=3155774 RepID=UPI0033DBDEB6